MANLKIKKLYLEGEEEIETAVPARHEVCPRCNGVGTHDPESFSNGFTWAEMEERGEEFIDNYFSGIYDVVCETCHGRNVVLVMDETNIKPELLKKIKEYDEEQARYEHEALMEALAERRMGC